MQASALIRDGGTLQIGIGCLGDAIVHFCRLRQRQSALYHQLLADWGILERHGDLIERIGGTRPFERGLYGASEMFVNGFLHLYRDGILKRKVYDSVPLQRLLNEGAITEAVDERTLRVLLERGAVSYTHLDVYKRQMHDRAAPAPARDGGQHPDRVMRVAGAFQAVHDQHDRTPLAGRPIQIQKVAVGQFQALAAQGHARPTPTQNGP